MILFQPNVLYFVFPVTVNKSYFLEFRNLKFEKKIEKKFEI